MAGITYIVSDLHIGDGDSYRDNFKYRSKRKNFEDFLDMVGKNELLILGDCFEFWQANIDLDITANEKILKKLTGMDVHYIAGNHDADLSRFYGDGVTGFTKFLNHPFFLEKSRKELTRNYGGKRFLFLHGHEGDDYNDKPAPDFGRAVTIIAGMLEDRIESRYIWKNAEKIPLEATLTDVSDYLLWIIDRLSRYFKRAPDSIDAEGDLTRELTGIEQENLTSAEKQRKMAEAVRERFIDLLRDAADSLESERNANRQGPRHKFLPDHLRQMKTLWKEFAGERQDDAVLVVGHTHMPGLYGSWYRNSGSWSDMGEDVLTLDHGTGEIAFHKWENSELTDNPPEDFSKTVPDI